MLKSVRLWRSIVSKEFRRLRFGLVPVDLTDAKIDGSEIILKSFLRNAGMGNLVVSPETHIEVFSIAKQYIGSSFRNWLFANYYNGTGARAEMVRKIVGYINGENSGMAIQNQSKIDSAKLGYARPNSQINTPVLYSERDFIHQNWVHDSVDFSKVKQEHMYDIFALLGPEGIARLCLSLNGVSNG